MYIEHKDLSLVFEVNVTLGLTVVVKDPLAALFVDNQLQEFPELFNFDELRAFWVKLGHGPVLVEL